MTLTIEQAGLMLADPLAYTDETRLHDGLALLRHQSPVHLVRAPGYRPFYAVTRHADVVEVERDGALWLSEPRPAWRPGTRRRATAGTPHAHRTRGLGRACLRRAARPEAS